MSGSAELAGVISASGVAKPDPILIASSVRRRFGGLVAVDVDHLEIQRGVITALIGPNGAGKTTLFNVLTGFDRADAGQWIFDGRYVSRAPPHRLARMGMVRTFQLTKALAKLTVLDNLRLAAPGQPGEKLWWSVLPFMWQPIESQVTEKAEEQLERFQLAHLRDEYAGNLSGGQRKLLDMARALMVEPRLVMLDEPMAGVNPALTQSLLAHITALRDDGTSVLFVEHDMDVVMSISDWVVCMAEGRVIAEGTPRAVASNADVIDAYLGLRHGEEAAPVAAATEDGSP